MRSNFPVISADLGVQAFYVACRQQGESHNAAEMFATRRGPNLSTDTTFLAGVGTLRSQFDDKDDELNRVVKAAREQGYEPKASDYYNPSLANRCGDPLAFVSSSDPKGHIRRVCEQRDLECHGGVEVKRKPKQ